MVVLPKYYAKRIADRLKPKLGNHARLLDLLVDKLGESGEVGVAALTEVLFPAAGSPASANASLNRFIATVNRVATENAVQAELHITANKRGGAAKRKVWFEGEIDTPASPLTGDLVRVKPELRKTDQTGIVLGAPVLLVTFNEHETRAVRSVFATAGELKETQKNGLIFTDLGLHGQNPVLHVISRQGRLNTLDTAKDAIAAVRPCAAIAVGIAYGCSSEKQRIGDVLISEFMRDYEPGRVNADGSYSSRGAKAQASDGLLNLINHLDHTRGNHPGWPKLRIGTLVCSDKLVDNRPYRDKLLALEQEAIGGEMEGAGLEQAARKAKVDWLIVKGICDWADGGKTTSTKDADQKLAATNAAIVVKAMLDFGAYQPVDPPPGKSMRSDQPPDARLLDRGAIDKFMSGAKGSPLSMHKDGDEAQIPTGRDGIEVLPYLHDWVADRNAPPFLALLAEYGMGKTITCQQFVLELNERRAKDPSQPLGLYFDLRHVTLPSDRVPSLAEILGECMASGWHDRGDGAPYDMATLNQWIDRGAVVVIDGLDEVLVRLSEANGQAFTNNVLKLLSDAEARAKADKRQPCLRMILSCRTHYFPSLRAQRTHFTQQERGAVDANRYRALVLLPWSDDQVRSYIGSAFPSLDIDRVMETVRSVHNLEELAARPFTLRLIAEYLPDIEQRRMGGETLYGITLYRKMVERWLDRDQGKHHIASDHKMRLAGHLAAHLSRDGNNALAFEELRDWFHEWRDSRPEFLRYRATSVDQLEEDLRTATFLVRRDEGERSVFRFAHTSLYEFFLADFLFRAAAENRPEDWTMPVPSRETLDFLGQMFAEATATNALQTLQGWRRVYRPGISELLFAYGLAARKQGWPAPILHGIDLAGAKLRWTRIDASPTKLDLGPANFAGADLRDIEWHTIRLEGADLSRTRLDYAVLIDADLPRGSLSEATLTAAVFRRSNLAGVDWTGAEGYRPKFLYCVGAPSADRFGVRSRIIAPAPGAAETLQARRPYFASMHRANSCAYSPDGRRLASAGNDSTLRIWDATTGEALATLTGHQDWVLSCAYSPDGRRLASAGFDSTLRIWDATTGEALATLTGHKEVFLSCAYSPDGRRLASASSDSTLRIWDATTGEALATLTGHQDRVLSCAYSPDGRRLASAGSDGTLRIWDATTGEALATLTGHKEVVLSCAYSPDGRRLASAGNDGALRIWDATTGEALATLTGHEAGISSCAYSPDGRRLASAGDDSTLRIWDATTGEALATLTGHKEVVLSCAYSPDGRRLASAGNDGTLRIWDATTGEALATFTGHQDWVLSCAYSPDGRRLASAGFDSTLRIWDATTGEALATLTGHKEVFLSCAYSPDGRRLASAGSDSTLRIWDATTGEALATLTGHEAGISSCAYSPDGRRLASAGFDSTLRIWDATTGEALATLTGHQDRILSCAYSPDGRRLASAGSDSTLRIWDATTGEALATLTGHQDRVLSCAYSPDGRRLASASSDSTLRIWDATTGEALATLTEHADWVRSCVYSPDGRRLASAGDDSTLRIWDAETGRLLRVHAPFRSDGNYGHAVWDPANRNILFASKGAWRFLFWQYLDDNGELAVLPYEVTGPVPVGRAAKA
jgi:WD40 repeat protein/nucleoside phosphorylase/uncharacterized protein YjbI with pentapeptide repeats